LFLMPYVNEHGKNAQANFIQLLLSQTYEHKGYNIPMQHNTNLYILFFYFRYEYILVTAQEHVHDTFTYFKYKTENQFAKILIIIFKYHVYNMSLFYLIYISQ